MPLEKTKDRIEYFVACVTEFSKSFGLDQQKSFDYLVLHIPIHRVKVLYFFPVFAQSTKTCFGKQVMWKMVIKN